MDSLLVNDQHAAAVARARQEDADWPKALSARFEPAVGLVLVKLNTGGWFGFEPAQAQQTAAASPKQLSNIEITPSGLGLYFPEIDGDVYLPSLLQGRWGSTSWMASQIGKLGGESKSAEKAAAARENGRKGGRPPKDRQGGIVVRGKR